MFITHPFECKQPCKVCLELALYAERYAGVGYKFVFRMASVFLGENVPVDVPIPVPKTQDRKHRGRGFSLEGEI